MIKINNLSLSLKNSELLKNLNFRFNEGEIIGLIGTAGAGKTLLLQILSGYIKKYSGEILLFDKPLNEFKKKKFNQTISCSSKKTCTNPDETVFNFLLYSRIPFKKFLNPYSEYDIQITEDYITQFELQRYRERKILSLSDDILKRVILAYSFIRSAKVLLLDNPTNDLNIHSISLLKKCLCKYVMNGDKISIIASNDINFITQTVDKFFLIDGGELVIEGNPEIIDSKLIKKYFHTEVLVSRNIYNGKPEIHLYN